MTRKLFIILALFFTLQAVNAKTISGQVTAVKDGDTIVVLKNKVTYTIRLDGIDCPEKKQAYGQKAKQFVSDKVFGRAVRVDYTKRDGYQRYLGIVYYGKGQNLNQELLRTGLAWHYKQYSKDKYLAKLEMNARSKKLGLWQDKSAIPPWEFRRQRRK